MGDPVSLFSSHIVHPIHTISQGRRATTEDVRLWVNTTTLSLSAEANIINANVLYDAMKEVTLETLHLDMPALPRAKRARGCVSTAAITEDEIKAFYVDLYISVMETGSRVLTQRYSNQDLEIVDLVRCTLEEENMAHEDLARLVRFYDGDVHLDNLRFKRNMWFEMCRQENASPTVDILRKKLVDEDALKWMIPNMQSLCVTYVCPPMSTCEAERSFSMLREIHTYLRSSQTQQRLNNCAILSAHRDIVSTMEFGALIEEFVDKTIQRKDIFGLPSLVWVYNFFTIFVLPNYCDMLITKLSTQYCLIKN